MGHDGLEAEIGAGTAGNRGVMCLGPRRSTRGCGFLDKVVPHLPFPRLKRAGRPGQPGCDNGWGPNLSVAGPVAKPVAVAILSSESLLAGGLVAELQTILILRA
jgi:hypothetical protein